MGDARCSSCSYRESRNVCGSRQSPNYKQTVQSDWKCDFFTLSQAKEACKEAWVADLADDVAKALEGYKKAIELGLPEDDEMFARSALAAGYIHVAKQKAEQSKSATEQLVQLPEFSESLKQMEKALNIDREGKYEYFYEPLNRARLRWLDASYRLVGRSLERAQGADAAIAFLQEKAGVVRYLPTTPLLLVMLSLGDLHAQKNQRESAANCYRSVVNSEPVDRTDEQGLERSIRREAAEKLSRLGSKVQPTPSPAPVPGRKTGIRIELPALSVATGRRLISILCFGAGAIVAYCNWFGPSLFSPWTLYRARVCVAISSIIGLALVAAFGAMRAGWKGAAAGAFGTYITLQALLSIASLTHGYHTWLLVYCLIWGFVYSLGASLFIRHFLHPEGGKVQVATKRLAASVVPLAFLVFLTDLLSAWRGVRLFMPRVGLVPPLLIRLLHLR
jgi:tetratricopeptide (TPR) repeat protein